MPSRTTSNASALFDAAFLARIDRLVLNARRRLRGGLSGEHQSRRRLPAPTFSDHRPYSVGDDLRHLDWRAYARHEELHLKLGETEQEVNVVIALDCSASLDWGEGDEHKGRYALRLAAMLGYLALSANDRTEIWPFTTRLGRPFGPSSSRSRGPDLLRYLGGLGWGERTSLDALTRAVRKHSGGMLVLISDLWSGGDLDALLRAAAPPRWQAVVLHLLHPAEIKPELSGPLELEDSETGAIIAIDVDDQARKEYHQRLVKWVRAAENTCKQRGATYAGIRTDRLLEKSTLPFLRRRGIINE